MPLPHGLVLVVFENELLKFNQAEPWIQTKRCDRLMGKIAMRTALPPQTRIALGCASRIQLESYSRRLVSSPVDSVHGLPPERTDKRGFAHMSLSRWRHSDCLSLRHLVRHPHAEALHFRRLVGILEQRHRCHGIV